MIVTQEYISSLMEQYGNMILRLSYTYLKNQADAEDIVQDVFVKILQTKPYFQDKAHEKAWIIRVTINLCKNKRNLFWNRNKCSIDEVAEASVCDTYHTESNVLTAVLSLPDKYRIVVYMYYYENYSASKISKIINKNESTVRSLLYRVRNRLKEVLKEECDFE